MSVSSDMTEILTPEQVHTRRMTILGSLESGMCHDSTDAAVTDLVNSHEALRERLIIAEQERDHNERAVHLTRVELAEAQTDLQTLACNMLGLALVSPGVKRLWEAQG